MIFTQNLASLAVAALLGSSTAIATVTSDGPRFETRYHRTRARRDDTFPNSYTGQPPVSAILDPVIPDGVNRANFDILQLNNDPVTLAWAGSTDGLQGGKVKREASVVTQGDFDFRFPTVPLDYSTYVKKITCKDGLLTAEMTSEGFDFVKKDWASAKDILFITAVDGCGQKDVNEFFHAKSVTFDDNTKSVLAKGTPGALYQEIANDMKLSWGSPGNSRLKRASDKRDVFENEDGLSSRATATGSFKTTWSAYLHDIWALGKDEDAPWDNAALLQRFDKDGGQKDESYKKGKQPKKKKGGKRTLGQTSVVEAGLAERDLAKREAENGLSLYCVDCGFRGEATIWGRVEASLWTFNVNKAEAGFKAEMHAGLNLGMEAFVKYEKSWKKDWRTSLPGGFKIPFLITVGPFIDVGVEATAGVDATGTLLIGADVNWDDIDVTLDLKNEKNSRARGLSPRIEKRAEATGELKVRADLGLPIQLGVGIDICSGAWKADAAIQETPKLNAEGSFQGYQAAVAGNGAVSTQSSTDTCHGVSWKTFVSSDLEAVGVATGLGKIKHKLMDTWNSDAITGCIGYEVEAPQASGAPVAVKSCQAVQNLEPPAGSVCKKVVSQSIAFDKFNAGEATEANDLAACALTCLNSGGCVSFSFSDQKKCQLYNAAVTAVALVTKNGEAGLEIYDKACFNGTACT